MNDRKRLEKMASETEEEKLKNATLMAFCKARFDENKLGQTEYVVSVNTADRSRFLDITSDGVNYVQLGIREWSDETGNFEGIIAILLCRYHGGVYESVVGARPKRKHPPNWEVFSEYLCQEVRNMRESQIMAIFERVRTKVRG